MSKQLSTAVQSQHILDFISHSAAQTIRLGQRLGELMRQGDLVVLLGDFGAGKTHMIKGIAQGLGSTDLVNSPSFVLINEYRAGSPIGWHRDAPQYAIVAGVSLLSPCRMRFRPYVSPGATQPSGGRRASTHEILLAPRSAYLMTGESRSAYEHSIPPVAELRYSVTFRTLRAGRGRSGRTRRLPRTGR